ncbi:hypothetical protein C8R44DRAFT_909731 [Mycena epipterygia]|nr:hypothetical protein C8R44DRAFT_909731 [Mycena epipterygia]
MLWHLRHIHPGNPRRFVPALPGSILEGGMPNLHLRCATRNARGVLSAEDVKPRACYPPPSPGQAYFFIELLALTTIHLRDDITLCTALLNLIKIPLSTRIQIYPSGVSSCGCRDILVPLRRHIRAVGVPTAALLLLVCRSTEGVTGISNLLMSTYEETAIPYYLNRYSALLTINSHPTNEGALRQIMSKVIKAVPLASITHLDLRLATQLTPTSCRTALKLLKEKEELANSMAQWHARALSWVWGLDLYSIIRESPPPPSPAMHLETITITLDQVRFYALHTRFSSKMLVTSQSFRVPQSMGGVVTI